MYSGQRWSTWRFGVVNPSKWEQGQTLSLVTHMEGRWTMKISYPLPPLKTGWWWWFTGPDVWHNATVLIRLTESLSLKQLTVMGSELRLFAMTKALSSPFSSPGHMCVLSQFQANIPGILHTELLSHIWAADWAADSGSCRMWGVWFWPADKPPIGHRHCISGYPIIFMTEAANCRRRTQWLFLSRSLSRSDGHLILIVNERHKKEPVCLIYWS